MSQSCQSIVKSQETPSRALTVVLDLINISGHGGHYSAEAESKWAGAGVALVFHAAVFSMTLILQSLCGAPTQASASLDRRRTRKAAVERDSESERLNCEEKEAQLFRLWSSSLCIGAAAMFGVWFVGDVGSIAALILGLMGVVFSVASWVPYALIGIDVSVMHGRQSSVDDADDSGRDGPQLDHITAVLAVHNGAICIPQILSSCTASLAFWIMKCFHLKAAVSWMFLIIVPSLLLAAWDRETLGLKRRQQKLVPMTP